MIEEQNEMDESDNLNRRDPIEQIVPQEVTISVVNEHVNAEAQTRWCLHSSDCSPREDRAEVCEFP